MIEILPMRPEHIPDAKYVICAVAWPIFQPQSTLEEFIQTLAEEHELDDLDNYAEVYSADRGLFLVVLDDGKLVGMGAVRKQTEEVAELKRIWLLESYHGRQIGFRVVSMLLDFAREHGYTSVYLESTQLNRRALAFYRKMGFQDVPSPHEDPIEVSMKMEL